MASLALRLILVLFICLADIAWAARWIYTWKKAGAMIPARAASSALGPALGQQLILSAVTVLLLLIAWAVYKKRFAAEMALIASTKGQRTAVWILVAALLCETAAALLIKAERGAVLYALLYYTVFIAFEEEFVVRGVCARLLQGEPTWLRYLWPNCFFAAMHFFSYADWGEITAEYALHFFTGSFLGLAAAGCLFQLLKEKTGTLWVPVLLHAALDLSVVFTY